MYTVGLHEYSQEKFISPSSSKMVTVAWSSPTLISLGNEELIILISMSSVPSDIISSVIGMSNWAVVTPEENVTV